MQFPLYQTIIYQIRLVYVFLIVKNSLKPTMCYLSKQATKTEESFILFAKLSHFLKQLGTGGFNKPH